MGWFSCYKVLKENNVLKRSSVPKKDFEWANRSNMPNDRSRAWDIAEQKIRDEINNEQS